MIHEIIKIVDEDCAGGFRIIDSADLKDGDVVINASEGLSISALRDALTAKGVGFDESAKKAELQALLDSTPA
jgi:HeH/LEM domain